MSGKEISEKKKTEPQQRSSWDSKWEFFFSCVGLSIGVGNVWRFPYVAFQNGGGAFLIPYFIMLVLAGKPIYFMELAIGQFSSKSPIKIWSCVPIAKGIGYSMILICTSTLIYYNVIIAQMIYFIGSVFQTQLPWMRCDAAWADGTDCNVQSLALDQHDDHNQTTTISSVMRKPISSAEVFFERKVLNSTESFEGGGIKYDLALCLLISWVIIVVTLIKGVKSSGKVAYFTAIFPYVSLFTLLVVSFLQPGAMNGVAYFLKPDWNRLFDISVWKAAASQVLISMSVGLGCISVYSSYNKFEHNIFDDTMMISVIDTSTSIISGLVTFAILGAMANDLNVSINEVVKEGPGLVFVVYPEALSRFPCPHLFSFLFFFMLYLLGLGTGFALLENVISTVCDEIEFARRHKLKLTVLVGIICFCLGLPGVTRSGKYFISVVDKYGASMPLVLVIFFEAVTIGWIYGVDNFAADIEFMLKIRLGYYWRFTWRYTAPLVLFAIGLNTIFANESLVTSEKVPYPLWTEIVGWVITGVIVGQIPLFALIVICKQKDGENLFEKIKLSLQANDEWGPNEKLIKERWVQRKSEQQMFDSNLIAINSSVESPQAYSNHGFDVKV